MSCLGCAGFAWQYFSVPSETIFAHIFSISNDNVIERRTLGAPVSLEFFFSVPSETGFAHISPVSKVNGTPKYCPRLKFLSVKDTLTKKEKYSVAPKKIEETNGQVVCSFYFKFR